MAEFESGSTANEDEAVPFSPPLMNTSNYKKGMKRVSEMEEGEKEEEKQEVPFFQEEEEEEDEEEMIAMRRRRKRRDVIRQMSTDFSMEV